ncbi:MAG: type II secretion system protein M [Desulfuromonadales bacterium]|nr:type II secretion system protein M [Desulfuromonadales bacterium]
MKLTRLNQREKTVVIGGLVVLVLLFVWFALLTPYLNSIKKLDRKIAAHQRGLVKVEKIGNEIVQLRKQLASVDTRKKGKRPLFSQVENITEQTGVRDQLFSMRPQPATTQGKFQQQLVEIRLKKVTLAQLVKLLHAVEYRSGGIQVKSMRVRPRFEDRAVLDVNMVLMSLEKL